MLLITLHSIRAVIEDNSLLTFIDVQSKYKIVIFLRITFSEINILKE